MKNFILLSVVLSAFSTASFAAELCGTLGSHLVGPHCVAGQACPHWVRVQYDLTLLDGRRIDLETSSTGILEDFGDFNGDDVCVSGVETRDGLDVAEISRM